MANGEPKKTTANEWAIGLALTRLLERVHRETNLLLGIVLVGTIVIWITMVIREPNTDAQFYVLIALLVTLAILLFMHIWRTVFGFRIDISSDELEKLADFFEQVKEMEKHTGLIIEILSQKKLMEQFVVLFKLEEKDRGRCLIARFSGLAPEQCHHWLRRNYDLYAYHRDRND